MSGPQKFFDEKQAAELLNVSRRTLQRWRTEGGGPRFIRLGERRVGYRLPDLNAWAEGRAFASHAEESSRAPA